jgi:hypothetical protein
MKPRPLSAVKIDPADILQCRRLYARLLGDAITSLRHPLRQDNASSKVQRAGRGDVAHRFGTLITWFLDVTDQGPFSFERCCAMAALDPTAVRDRLRAEGLLQAPEVRITESLAAREERRRDVPRAA